MVTASGAASVAERVRSYRTLVEALPFPAMLLDAAGDDWRVLLANDAFARMVSEGVSPLGRALRDVLPQGSGAPVLADLLANVRRTARSVRSLYIALGGPAPARNGRWVLELLPLTDEPGTVWGILASLQAGEGAAAHHSAERGALSHLASGMLAERPLRDVYDDSVQAAVVAAGAERGVLLLSEGGRRLAAVAATPQAGVPALLDVEDLSSPVWQVAFGRHRLIWTADSREPPPVPFAGDPGWERLVMVGLRMRGRSLGVLVVGGPRSGSFDEPAVERLELAAVLASTALDNAGLLEQFRRLEQVLRGAVATSAALVEATEPFVVRRQLLQGLVTDMGLAGAALWESGEQDGGLDLVDAAGLPDDVRDLVASLPADSIAARLHHGTLPDRRAASVTSVASSSWTRHEVRLVRVPEPSPGILGVYVTEGLPGLVDDVLATLAHALAAAVHQTTLHRRVRTVADSLVRELRSHDTPRGVEVGTVYRSAAAGVEVGGDFLDVFTTASGQIGMACGDVSGKGVEAASLAAMAVYTLRAYALGGAAPQVVMTTLNEVLCAQTPAERFVTLAYARIDPRCWKVEVCVAGHPAPVLVGPGGVRVLDVAPDTPVGVDEAARYTHSECALEPGESLLLHTDGVTEARRGGTRVDKQLGTAGLMQVLDAHRDEGGEELAGAVWHAVEEWTQGGTTDDCAVIVLRRPPEPPAAPGGPTKR